MFATLDDIYIRFGRTNVLAVANLDALDVESDSAEIEKRIIYFIRQAYEMVCDALRQGSYSPETITEPYPQTLVNLNCEVAYIQMYRAKHSEDETAPDAYQTLEENASKLMRSIQGGAVRFHAGVQRAMSIPVNVDANFMKKR